MDLSFTPMMTTRLGRSGLAVLNTPTRTRHVYTRALILFLRSDFLHAEGLVSKSSFLVCPLPYCYPCPPVVFGFGFPSPSGQTCRAFYKTTKTFGCPYPPLDFPPRRSTVNTKKSTAPSYVLIGRPGPHDTTRSDSVRDGPSLFSGFGVWCPSAIPGLAGSPFRLQCYHDLTERPLTDAIRLESLSFPPPIHPKGWTRRGDGSWKV